MSNVNDDSYSPSKVRSLLEAVSSAVKIDLVVDEHDEAFQAGLAEIQNALGQNDGMAASMFFDDKQVSKWKEGTKEQRITIIANYVAFEIQHGLSASA